MAKAKKETLKVLAGKITACFSVAEKAETDAQNKRIVAGKLLLEARTRVEGGEGGFTFRNWCADNVKRSWRDILRCIQLVKATDPVKAHEAAKAATRASTARSRAAKKTPPASAPLMIEYKPAPSLPMTGARSPDPVKKVSTGIEDKVSLTDIFTGKPVPEPRLRPMRLPDDPPPIGVWDERLGQYFLAIGRAMCNNDDEAVKELNDHPQYDRAKAFFATVH